MHTALKAPAIDEKSRGVSRAQTGKFTAGRPDKAEPFVRDKGQGHSPGRLGRTICFEIEVTIFYLLAKLRLNPEN